MRVGFIGLGTMGGNAARNIARRGFPLVVHDIRPEAARTKREPVPVLRRWEGVRARGVQVAGNKGPAAARRHRRAPGGGGPKAGVPSGARCSVWRRVPSERGGTPRRERVPRAVVVLVSRTWSPRS